MITRLEKELFSACRAGDVDRVRRAIAAGVDPKKAINKDSILTETPLHIACAYVIINFIGVVGGMQTPFPRSHLPIRQNRFNSDHLPVTVTGPTHSDIRLIVAIPDARFFSSISQSGSDSNSYS